MKKIIILATVFLSVNAFAGNCELTVDRTACAGQEAESYKKCNGEKKCVSKIEATSDKDCAKKALKDCANGRLDITQSKIITATYEGKPVDAGKNFCDAKRADFNKCK